jgi:hypothetical protein
MAAGVICAQARAAVCSTTMLACGVSPEPTVYSGDRCDPAAFHASARIIPTTSGAYARPNSRFCNKYNDFIY